MTTAIALNVVQPTQTGLRKIRKSTPMPTNLPLTKPSLTRSSVLQVQSATASHAEILSAIADLKRERQAQAQFNRYAKLSQEECEQHAAIAAHYSAQAQKSANQAERAARSMPDPASILLVSIGASFLVSLVVSHLYFSNHETTSQQNQPARVTRSR